MLAVLLLSMCACSTCGEEKDTESEDSPKACIYPPTHLTPRQLPNAACIVQEKYKKAITLPIEYKVQQCTLWCWTATLSMLAEYNGNPVSACKVASIETGKNCCAPDACLIAGCNRVLDLERVTPLLSLVDIQAEHISRALTEAELRTEIGSGRPVLIALRVRPFTNDEHVLLVTGFSEQMFFVLDPDLETASGTTQYAYDQLVNKYVYGWKWIESWKISSKKTGGCL